MPEFDSTLEFRPVPGFPGYCVGSDGSVWTCLRRTGTGRWGHVLVYVPDPSRWRPLKLRLMGKRKKRFGVSLQRAGKSFNRYPHLLVLEAFVGPRPPGLEACHNDGNAFNNHPSNLRWDTPAANKADMVRHGTRLRGEQVGSAVYTVERVREVRRLRSEGWGKRRIAKLFGMPRSSVDNMTSGRRWGWVD